MWIIPLSYRSSPVLLTFVALFANSAHSQAPQSPPTSLANEVTEMRVENGVPPHQANVVDLAFQLASFGRAKGAEHMMPPVGRRQSISTSASA